MQLPDGQQTLCMLPAKFNKKLWVKRGGYLIIERDDAADSQQANDTALVDSGRCLSRGVTSSRTSL